MVVTHQATKDLKDGGKHFALWLQVQACSLEFLKQIKVTIKDSSSSSSPVNYIYKQSKDWKRKGKRWNGRKESGDLSKMEWCWNDLIRSLICFDSEMLRGKVKAITLIISYVASMVGVEYWRRLGPIKRRKSDVADTWALYLQSGTCKCRLPATILTIFFLSPFVSTYIFNIFSTTHFF